jgi:O-antigen/teichoic acid export membrane protein
LSKKSIEKRALESTIAGFILFALNIVQSILLVPILLKYWGAEKYAIWIAIWAFIMLMRTIDIGHLNLIGNEFSNLYFQDKIKARDVLGSAVKVALLMGLVEIILFGLSIISNVADELVGIQQMNNIKELEYSILIALLPWALAGGAISIVLRAIPALGLYSQTIYAGISLKILEILILIYCALYNKSFLFLCTLVCISNVSYVFFLFLFLKKLMPFFIPFWKYGTWKQGLINFKRSLALTVNGFFEQYSNNLIILFISNTSGLAMVPAFTTMRTIANTSLQATNIVLEPLGADIIRLNAKNEKSKIADIFRTNWFILGNGICLSFIFLMPFIETLYVFWTNNEFKFDANVYFLLILSVSVINYGKSFFILIRGLNKLLLINIITIVRISIVLLISIALFFSNHLSILALSLLVSEIVASIIVPLFFVRKHIPQLTLNDYLRGAFPTILLFLFYSLCFLLSSNWWIILTVIFGIIQITLIWWQWKHLPESIRDRLLKLLPINLKSLV